MRMQVSGITVAVTKKDIKNIHLSVMPPNGDVRISAPLKLSDESIKIFVRTKVAWIKRQQEKFANQARLSEREYVSGESIFIFGRQYYLRVQHDRVNGFVIDGQNVVLTVREASTAQQRENYVNEKLREMLVAEIEKRLPAWEKKTHLKCNGCQTKIMQNKWGSCNPAGKLWFNGTHTHPLSGLRDTARTPSPESPPPQQRLHRAARQVHALLARSPQRTQRFCPHADEIVLRSSFIPKN